MAYEKPYAYLDPMCASENSQWCGELYFAVSAISIGAFEIESDGLLPRKISTLST
jgi:hypothetical protein